MTLASIRNTWKQGSLLFWATVRGRLGLSLARTKDDVDGKSPLLEFAVNIEENFRSLTIALSTPARQVSKLCRRLLKNRANGEEIPYMVSHKVLGPWARRTATWL